MIGKFAKLADRLEELPGAGVCASGNARGCFEQVRPANRADKHKVASEKSHRSRRAAAFIGEQIADMLRRMAGDAHTSSFNLPDAQHVAMLDEATLIAAEILPIGRALPSDKSRVARARSANSREPETKSA